MSKTQQITLLVNDIEVPLRIVRERRQSMRVAIGKKAVILRMPSGLLAPKTQKGIDWAQAWLEGLLKKKPDALQHLIVKTYNSGHQIQVGNRHYELEIEYKDKKTHSARLHGNIIQLSLAKTAEKATLQKAIKHLCSRIVGQDFLPEIEQRVHDLNTLHFQKKITQVRLKYNHSNWGSCSSKSNINLSTRLLFAPQDVIDYVIIHELAHLTEANHSSRFWALVAKVMPDYKMKEKWLKVNGKSCDF